MMNTVSAGTEIPLQLVSRKGLLLGTITLPWQWHQTLRDTGILGLAVNPKNRSTPVRCTILQVSWPDHPEAYELAGFTPQQFERLPGCAFVPQQHRSTSGEPAERTRLVVR